MSVKMGKAVWQGRNQEWWI